MGLYQHFSLFRKVYIILFEMHYIAFMDLALHFLFYMVVWVLALGLFFLAPLNGIYQGMEVATEYI